MCRLFCILKEKTMASDINIKIGANISDLQKKLNQAEKSMRRAGQKMTRMGDSLIMGLTAPIAAFGAMTLQTAANFESAMNGMKAVTSGADASFGELEATAKELGATTQFSATQAAEGMEMLGRNGLTASQILDGAAKSSLMLAAATGTDLSNAANIATDAMAQFKLEASDLAGVADLITGATVNSKFGIDDFQNAMAQAGGVAGAVGVSFDDFATTVAAISPSFASGADAGTSLKTMLTRLVPETANAEAMMRKLGIITADGTNQFFTASGEMKSMSDIAGVMQNAFAGLSEAQRIQAAKTLFGTDAMRAGLQIAETGSVKFDELKESIAGVGAEGVAETRMEGLNGAILRLKSAFETFQLAIAEGGLSEFAASFVEGLTGILLRLSELDPKIITSSSIILGLVAAIGPAIRVVGMLKIGYGNLMGVFSSITGVVNKVILGIQTLTVAELRNTAIANAKLRVMGIYNTVLNTSKAILNAFRISTIRNTAATIANTAANVAQKVAVFATVAAIQAAMAIETTYMAVKGVLTGKIKLMTVAQAALNAVMLANPIGLVVAAVVLLIMAFVAAYQNLEGFRNFVDNAMDFIRDKFGKAIEKIKYIFMNLPAYLNASAAALKQFVQNVVSNLKRMALKAKGFMKKFQKAFTISKDKRAELQKEIEGIVAEEELLAENAKSIADVFNERLAEGIENGEQLDTEKIKNNIQGKLEGVMDMLGLGGITGGGQSIDLSTGDGKTEEEKKYEALRKVNDELDKNTKSLEDNKKAAVQYNGESTVMAELNKSIAGSYATLHANQKKVTEYRESREFKTIEKMNAKNGNGAATYARINEELEKLIQASKDLAESALVDIGTQIGEGIGDMLNGTATIGDMGKTVLKSLAGVLGQLGQLAIKAGVAMLGIQEMFEKGLAGGPAAPLFAIGAGIALVALSKFASSKIDSMGSGGGDAGGGEIPALANGGVVNAPTLALIGEAGPEAVIPLSRMNNMFGGGGESLKVDFSMDKMVIALDRQRKRNSRVN